jgi:phosphatidylinositol glycan class M
LSVFVLTTLYYAAKRQWDATAVWFGLSVHWKIYPIVYGSSLLMAIGEGRHDWAVKPRVRFGALAAATFFAVGGVMYIM